MCPPAGQLQYAGLRRAASERWQAGLRFRRYSIPRPDACESASRRQHHSCADNRSHATDRWYLRHAAGAHGQSKGSQVEYARGLFHCCSSKKWNFPTGTEGSVIVGCGVDVCGAVACVGAADVVADGSAGSSATRIGGSRRPSSF